MIHRITDDALIITGGTPAAYHWSMAIIGNHSSSFEWWDAIYHNNPMADYEPAHAHNPYGDFPAETYESP